MTRDADVERALTAWFEAEAPSHEPDGLLRTVDERTNGMRRRPRWLVLGGGRASQTLRVAPQAAAASADTG